MEPAKQIGGYEVNKKYFDEWGRVSGVFAVNKKEGITSHDLIDYYRKYFGTSKVGHAGTLDPFASGLLIILVNKALPLADEFLTLDKTYEASVLFGISTDTLDPEGKIVEQSENDINISDEQLKNALASFSPEYQQYKPIFSSVKVNGAKLRKLAREFESYQLIQKEEERYVQFFKNGKMVKELKVPSSLVKIYQIDLLKRIEISKKEVMDEFNKVRGYFSTDDKSSLLTETDFVREAYPIAEIKVTCSKGTYIRQLAYDLGLRLNPVIPAQLLKLKRTQIGKLSLDDCFQEENQF